jgi:hypothetical protein
MKSDDGGPKFQQDPSCHGFLFGAIDDENVLSFSQRSIIICNLCNIAQQARWQDLLAL